MVPTIPPKPLSEPTHAISVDVNGPFSNDDAFDSSIRNADDVDRTQIFAITK